MNKKICHVLLRLHSKNWAVVALNAMVLIERIFKEGQ
jgi:hypothetical protein